MIELWSKNQDIQSEISVYQKLTISVEGYILGTGCRQQTA